MIIYEKSADNGSFVVDVIIFRICLMAVTYVLKNCVFQTYKKNERKARPGRAQPWGCPVSLFICLSLSQRLVSILPTSVLSGSMTFRCGSGFGSCYFRHWPSRRQKKLIFFKKFFLLITFWRYIYIIFQRSKVQKKSPNSRNQYFSYYFCLMTEGSGSLPLSSGSGSGRLNNMWLWIRNTAT